MKIVNYLVKAILNAKAPNPQPPNTAKRQPQKFLSQPVTLCNDLIVFGNAFDGERNK